jgi:hypothetical protein
MGHLKRIYKKLSSKLLPGHDPSFLIIGAQKAGTTSLHAYLEQHPRLASSFPKEVNYFSRHIYRGKDLNWYRQCFTSLTKPNALFFESTPNYMNSESVAQDIAKHYPAIKLIIVLRDPVARAFSGWNMYRSYSPKQVARKKAKVKSPQGENRVYKYLFKNRTEVPPFRDIIETELDFIARGSEDGPFILRKGLYADQINMYYRYFDQSQILILGFRDLINAPAETCNQILKFLGVDGPPFQHKIQTKNKGDYTSRMSEADRLRLQEFYQEPNLRLTELLGKELNW